MKPLDIALDYTGRLGWSVFPCREDDEIDGVTGEILFSAKSPRTSNGLRGASKNERIVTEWFENRYPTALIGSPTGENMGAWVLDIDIKQGVGNGFEWLEQMEEEHGKLPHTAAVSTPRGGRHLYFNHVSGIKNRGNLGHCIDVRGSGGFVILAGSQMANGLRYEWFDGTGPEDITDAPEWLLRLVLPQERHTPRHDYAYAPGTNEPYVERALDSELTRLATCPPGGRGHQLNASAYSLGQLVASGALSRADAESELYAAAAACGVLAKDGERETWSKIRRGLGAGERQPRAIPERHDDNTRLVDVKRMIANGLKKAEKANGDIGTNIGADNIGTDIESGATNPTPIIPDVEESSQQSPFVVTPFTWIDPATLPRREFAYGNHYIRKYVSVTVSPGGLGKTSNSIAESLAMVSGKALLGVKPPNRMRVSLFNAEDPRDELDRRIMAACLHYKLKPDDLDGLYMDTGREQELVVAIEDKRTGVRYMVPVIEAVIANIRRHAIDVMIVDPFVSTHGVNENDNGAIDKVAKLWAHIADETNCAIDIVHHLRKVADREATVEDARGAVALIGAARSVRVLNRMSPEQAAQAGVSENDRTSYFNVHQGKANLTRMSNAQDWRKLESVPLGNGRGLAKPQDHAGVVTEWKWPSAEDVAAEITDAQFADVASLLGGTAYKLTANSKPWAGEAIAAVLGLDPDDKAVRKRCGVLLRAWVDDGRLAVIEERDPHTRHLGKFVRAT